MLSEQFRAAVMWDSRAGEAGGHTSRGNQARGENMGCWQGFGVGGCEWEEQAVPNGTAYAEVRRTPVWRLGPNSDCLALG